MWWMSLGYKVCCLSRFIMQHRWLECKLLFGCSKAEMAHLRLAAASGIIKLTQEPVYAELVTLDQFQALALLMQVCHLQCRREHVHKGTICNHVFTNISWSWKGLSGHLTGFLFHSFKLIPTPYFRLHPSKGWTNTLSPQFTNCLDWFVLLHGYSPHQNLGQVRHSPLCDLLAMIIVRKMMQM